MIISPKLYHFSIKFNLICRLFKFCAALHVYYNVFKSKSERCSTNQRFFKKRYLIRLPFSKKCPNGVRKCKRITTKKLPFTKVAFYKFRTINVFNFGLALKQTPSKLGPRTSPCWSLLAILCSNSPLLSLSLAFRLFGPFFSLWQRLVSLLFCLCFCSAALQKKFLFAAVRLAGHSNLTSSVLMSERERSINQCFNWWQDLLQTIWFI